MYTNFRMCFLEEQVLFVNFNFEKKKKKRIYYFPKKMEFCSTLAYELYHIKIQKPPGKSRLKKKRRSKSFSDLNLQKF